MIDLDTARIKVDLSEEKRWFTYEDDVRFLVARLGNKLFVNALNRLRKPYNHLIRRGKDLPEHASREITAKAMAEGLLFDWEGLTKGGEPLVYDEDVGAKYLADRQYQWMSDFVINCAEAMESEYQDSFRDSEGNSSV